MSKELREHLIRLGVLVPGTSESEPAKTLATEKKPVIEPIEAERKEGYLSGGIG